MMQEKILITGGAGFIGSHCVDALLSCGAEVSVLDLKTEEEASNLSHVLDKITYTSGDIRNSRTVRESVSGHTHILHLAAMVSVPASIEDPVTAHDINVNGTLHVLEAAREEGIRRVVYASSAAVYGDTKEIPTAEQSPLAPLSPYGLHKVINELYGKLYEELYGCRAIGLRFFNVYGSRQDASSPYSGVISIFTKLMQKGERPTIYGDGATSRDFVYVGDVVSTCLEALFTEKSTAAVYNVGTGSSVDLQTLVSTLNSALDTDIEPIYAAKRDGDIVHSCASTERLRELQDVDSFSRFESGIKQMVHDC